MYNGRIQNKTSTDTRSVVIALATEIPEPEDWQQLLYDLRLPAFSESFTSSFLRICPKVVFMASTHTSGVHSGKMHLVMVLWKPGVTKPVMRGFPFNDKRARKQWHTGQQHFDTPMTRVKSYHHELSREQVKQRQNQPESLPIAVIKSSKATLLSLSSPSKSHQVVSICRSEL